jgi:glyoxylate reductase
MSTVLLSRRLPDPVMEELNRLFTLIGNVEDRPITRQELLTQVCDADALIVTLTDTVDMELFSNAPRLRVVALYAAGYNNVDVAAAKARAIIVTNTPDVLTETTADLAWGLLLAVSRRIPEAERLAREGRWMGWGPTQFLGCDVHGKTLGIIGMGRIGQAVARRASGFGMPVIYSSRRDAVPPGEKTLNGRHVSLPTLLATADFVSLHVPLTEDTRHLIGKEQLALMRRTAYLINTARGALVDEAALAKALAAGHPAGAGLDVYEHEPHIHPDLLRLPNVVLLPHLGSATLETRVRMGMMVMDNIIAALSGKEPPNRVV